MHFICAFMYFKKLKIYDYYNFFVFYIKVI
jgi:hypothetical protein